MMPLLAVYYDEYGQSWPSPPTGLTLCTPARPKDITAPREPDQLLVDWGVPLLCVLVLELLLRWREAWAAARAQARRDASQSVAALGNDGPGQTEDAAAGANNPGTSATTKAGGSGGAPMRGGISRGGYWAGLLVCLFLFFRMAPVFNRWGDLDLSVPGMAAAMLMLTCLAARRLRGQGLRAAWALPALVPTVLLLLGTLVPPLQWDWFLVWPEVSPRRFSLMMFVHLWSLAFFIGLALFNVTSRRRARRG